MYKLAICDDEEIILKQINNLAKNYFMKRKLKFNRYLFRTGKELLDSCENNKYDCIFIDINLGIENGIDIIKAIRKKCEYPTNVVFVTGYEEYKTQVLNLHTFDYLIKPFKNSEFEKVLDDLLLWYHSYEHNDIKKLHIKTIEGLITLSLQEILYFEYIDRRIEIQTKKTTYHLYGKMKDMFEILNSENFAIPHISFIVNLSEINRFYKSKFMLEMTDGKLIPISQLKMKEFKIRYYNFIEKMTEG